MWLFLAGFLTALAVLLGLPLWVFRGEHWRPEDAHRAQQAISRRPKL